MSVTDQELQNIENKAKNTRHWLNIDPQDVLRLAADLRRLRAGLATAHREAERGDWTACRDALREAGE